MHWPALSKGPEVDGYEANAIDQIDHDLLSFAIIPCNSPSVPNYPYSTVLPRHSHSMVPGGLLVTS
jgi:hypothetical protein